MSGLEDFQSKLNIQLDSILTPIRKKIFGVNNERLDFFMDSFYKLDPQKRVAVVSSLIGMIILFVIGAIFLYFSQVQDLQDELNSSFEALNKIKTLRVEEKVEAKRFDALTETIKKKIRGLKFKPFFEKLSRQQNVSISNLREDREDLDPLNPLAKDIQLVRVSMKLPKISVPSMLKFLVEVERSEKYLRVSDLKITGLYGNKLYFDANVIVKGYTIKR